MVHWFSPGFSACTHRFETRLTSGILFDAGMGWGALRFVLCCRFGSVPDLILVVCDRDLSLNVTKPLSEHIRAQFRVTSLPLVTARFLTTVKASASRLVKYIVKWFTTQHTVLHIVSANLIISGLIQIQMLVHPLLNGVLWSPGPSKHAKNKNLAVLQQ